MSVPGGKAPLPWGTKRGEVVRDRNGDLWRRSNGPNIYLIDANGHRLHPNGYRATLRISYALGTHKLGPFVQDAETERLSR